MDLSFIIPCYNEAENLPDFLAAVTSCMDGTGISYELVFVDDGSSDASRGLLRRFSQERREVRYVSFSRNFGKEAAIYAGLEHVRGDAVCIIDADLQQDPKTALEMYGYLQEHEEYDCVAAYQEDRHEGRFLGFCKRKFYKIFNKMGTVDLPVNMSDFRVFRRAVAESLVKMPEVFRFSKGLFAWVGFNTYPFPYTANARTKGKSTWSFWHLMHYGIGGIVSFTTAPLKIATFVGSVVAIAAFIYIIRVIIEKLAFGIVIPGYPTLISVVLFLGGLQLIVLGIIGEYLARVYIEGKHRPIYIARESSDDYNA